MVSKSTCKHCSPALFFVKDTCGAVDTRFISKISILLSHCYFDYNKSIAWCGFHCGCKIILNDGDSLFPATIMIPCQPTLFVVCQKDPCLIFSRKKVRIGNNKNIVTFFLVVCQKQNWEVVRSYNSKKSFFSGGWDGWLGSVWLWYRRLLFPSRVLPMNDFGVY